MSVAIGQAYRTRPVEVAGDPLEAAVRAADLVEHAGWDPFVVHEGPDGWRMAAGAAAEIVVTPRAVRLRDVGGREHSRPCGSQPLRVVADLLGELGVPGWRLYGAVAFELALLGTAEAEDLDPDRALVRLFVPRVEAACGPGPGWVRVLEGADTGTDAGTGADELADELAAALAAGGERSLGPVATVRVDDDPDGDYAERVADAVHHIGAGAFTKVIVSRALELDPALDVDLNGSLLLGRRSNTPARSFRLALGGLDAVGFSPETVLEVAAGGRVSTQPLAGTCARSGEQSEDDARAARLCADPKEVAEHAVSVRAACDELAAVSAAGSVHVEQFMETVARGSVMHLASRVTGRLAGGESCWSALERLFPAITASGVPKDAACAYVHRTEDRLRGLYAGAVVVADADGALDAALVLRSVYRRDGRAWLRAGAGIVTGSRPEREFTETCEKLRSVSATVALRAHPATGS